MRPQAGAGKLICAPICLQWFTRANWRRFGGTFLFNPAAPEIRLICAPICLQWFTRANWRQFGGTFLFNPAAPEIRLKHAPPMRRSRLEMYKLQGRARRTGGPKGYPGLSYIRCAAITACPSAIPPSLGGTLRCRKRSNPDARSARATRPSNRSEEHTSELQSLRHLVCRL